MARTNNIVMVGYGKRNIKSGNEYDKYFEKPKNIAIEQGNNSIQHNVDKVIPAVVRKYKHEAKKIADLLYTPDTIEFSKRIWTFLFNHIQYEYDEFGVEQFRTPYRSWADRNTGIDCDCFSIFASSILSNKNVPHYIRITKYNNNSKWQHIYVLVAIPGREFNSAKPDTYTVIDAVMHAWNKEKDYTDQKTYKMESNLGIVTEVLNGMGTADTNVVEDLLNGTADDLSGDNLHSIYNHLTKTRDWVIKNPSLMKTLGENPNDYLQMLDYAIDNFWKSEKIRNKAFENLAKAEAQMNKEMGITEEDIESLEGFADDIDNLVDNDDVYDFDGIGNHVDDEIDDLGKVSRSERKKKRQAKRAERKATRNKKRATKRAKKAAKKEIRKETKVERKAERKENKAERKQERKQAKGFFRKVGVALKQGGKSVFVKNNPAVMASRTGFLAAVRLNMFRLAKRLKYAYGTEAEAKKDGVNYQAALKMKDNIEKIFADKLMGKRTALKKAVLMASLNGIDEQNFEGLAGLGVVGATGTMAAVLSAVPVIVKVVNAIASVESEYGVDGLGSIQDDVDEFEFFAEGISNTVNGLDGLNGEKIDASVITAWIKKFFAKLKERRDVKKSMSKEEYKEFKKTEKAMRKDEKRNAKASNTSMLDIAAKAQETLDTYTGENVTSRSADASTENLFDDLETKSTTKDNSKRNMIIGVGLAVAMFGGAFILSKKQASKQKTKKALAGVSKPQKKTIKKVQLP